MNNLILLPVISLNLDLTQLSTKMTKHTCIGIFHDTADSYPITIHNLIGEIKRGVKWSAAQYCDRRYTTNLLRFNYDPWTGEEIDWKEVKRFLLIGVNNYYE